MFKEELTPIVHKLFQNIEEEGTLSNSSYKVTINTLIPKPDKDITRKASNRPISLRNRNEKIFNKILTNQIQQHIKRIIDLP